MIEKIKNIRQNTEFVDTILVGSGTIIGAFFSYLLQFVLGRKLSVEDYGTFNALLSLSSLVGVFAAVFGISLVKVVSEIFVKDDIGNLKYLFVKLIKFSLIAGLSVFVIIFVLRGYISSGLKIGDNTLIILFALSVGLSFLTSVPISYMQGMQKFKKYSLFQIINLFNRFLIPTVLVFLGFGLRGVFSGLPMAAVISFSIGVSMLGLGLKNIERVDLSKYYKKMVSFGISFILVNFSMMAFANVDLIMVKKYFSPMDAGYYAGTMTLGKILLFGAGAVSVVMFPKITALYSKGDYFFGKLKKLFFMLIFILFVGVLCYQIFPGIITKLFFGKAFENSVKFLPMFSVFVAVYALINFFVLFFLAVDKKVVGLLLLPGVLAQFILLNIFHGSIFDVIKVNIGVSVFTLFLLSVYFYLSVPGLKSVKKFDFVEEVPPLSIG